MKRSRGPAPGGQQRARVSRRIIGIDPGLASTGWGLIDCSGGKIRYVDHGSIETKADRPRAERLFFIMESIRSILENYQPAEAAIETLYFGRNVSSAIPVAESRGVVSAILAERGMTISEFTPNAIKKGITGVSAADKKQVQEMVRIILGLSEIPRPDHAADALGAAICAANSG
ncbi:crossover junction endodeoxyribonuclease RuvC [Spirochaetia bacterium]|nr:crossover junction endodeoxyribonuclease RuvC [Spirochaetia bacterium]